MLGQNDNINLEINEKKSLVLRLFGNYYFLILAIIVGLGIIYLNNIDFFTTEMIITNLPAKDTSKTEADLPMVKGSISAPVDINKFSVTTPELVEKGKILFQTNCVTCHGAEGKGDGVAGVSLNPKPRNFTELTDWKNGPKLVQIYKTLQEGVPGSGMASFSTLPPEDRFALIHYIQTFRNDYPKSTDTELKELDKTYSLSTGVKLPNQIPVKLAMEKVIQDNKPVEDKIKSLSASVEKDNSEGALIFRKISKNIQRSVRTLVSNTRWNENESEFVNLIGTEQLYNGFNTGVYTLTTQETASVYQYLKNLFANFKT